MDNGTRIAIDSPTGTVRGTLVSSTPTTISIRWDGFSKASVYARTHRIPQNIRPA